MKWALVISALLHALIWKAKPSPEPLVWTSAPIYVSPAGVVSKRQSARSSSKAMVAGSASPAPSAGGKMSMENVVRWGNSLPLYPAEAERAGWEGEVVLRLSFENGNVTGVLVEKSSGYHSLDESALAAARQWKFPPERVGREATIPIRFELN